MNTGDLARSLTGDDPDTSTVNDNTVGLEPIHPAFEPVADLVRNYPALRKPVIDGILRCGETMNFISSPKVGKSWLAVDLLLSVASGRPWLGLFPVERGPVLLLDAELHRETLSNRIPRVMEARGIDPSEVANTFYVESLRGRLRDVFAMASYFSEIDAGRFKAIGIDALYRFLPANGDENSNSGLASVYNAIDQYAAMTGAAIVCVHHSTKGTQSQKSVTDVGSGGGSQSRAVDCHMVLREHEEPGAVVLEAALRSWAPLQPLALRWDFPLFHVAGDLDPTKLKQPGSKKTKKTAEPEEQAPPAWDAGRFVESFLSDEPRPKDLIVARSCVAGLSERAATRFLNVAIAEGKAHKWVYKADKKTYYSVVQQPITAYEEPPKDLLRARTPPYIPRVSREATSGLRACERASDETGGRP